MNGSITVEEIVNCQNRKIEAEKVTKKKNAQALSKGRDFKNDKFKKSVTTKRGNDTGKVGNSLNPRDKNFGKSLTGTTKTKAKLIGKGNKTKSFKLEGTEGSGKAVGKDKLERKNDSVGKIEIQRI